MHGGFLLDPLPLVTAMVHPVGDVRQFQRPILHLGPSFPPPLDLAALLLVQLARLFPQPLRPKAARRRHPVCKIGRASCRESVLQYVYIPVSAVSLTKKK